MQGVVEAAEVRGTPDESVAKKSKKQGSGFRSLGREQVGKMGRVNGLQSMPDKANRRGLWLTGHSMGWALSWNSMANSREKVCACEELTVCWG